jgi:hypothetical protein
MKQHFLQTNFKTSKHPFLYYQNLIQILVHRYCSNNRIGSSEYSILSSIHGFLYYLNYERVK